MPATQYANRVAYTGAVPGGAVPAVLVFTGYAFHGHADTGTERGFYHIVFAPIELVRVVKTFLVYIG